MSNATRPDPLDLPARLLAALEEIAADGQTFGDPLDVLAERLTRAALADDVALHSAFGIAAPAPIIVGITDDHEDVDEVDGCAGVNITIELDVALNEGVVPDLAVDAIHDLLCSVGEDKAARETVDQLVASFDGADWQEQK